MSRRYANQAEVQIEVKRRDDEPQQFLWRDRLYLVREVLAHWTESGRWWASPRVSGLVSGGTVSGGSVSGGSVSGGASDGPAGSVEDAEREYWRVEAAAGRSETPGVYDLCFDWSRGRWHIACVLD